VPLGNRVRVVIRLSPGVYREPVYVAKTKNFITLAHQALAGTYAPVRPPASCSTECGRPALLLLLHMKGYHRMHQQSSITSFVLLDGMWTTAFPFVASAPEEWACSWKADCS
jgi:hypothetical protein